MFGITVDSERKGITIENRYEALDTMHAASHRDNEAIHRIKKIVENIGSRTHQQVTEARKPKTLSPQQKKTAENIAFQKQTMYRHPDAEPILSRPRPFVAGQRQIPKLVSARGVPFLRIKKPQPQNLSRIIRYKLRFKDKLVERRERLLIDTLFAKDEEDWDRLIEGQPVTPRVIHAHHPIRWIEGSWMESPLECYKKAFYDNIEFEKKQQELAEKMWEVVLAERKLAAEEEEEAKEARKETEKPPSVGSWISLIQKYGRQLVG
ncbi:DNA repair protein (Rad1), putative [Talaromyces stipitatus ATCC 10500]|uniref:DNA repair protein (Rad1), putative n=1 Tax=Talaromyces stipitatus (strain ATCC 10500 / CBS 375.48 / QM 6759 / NRRL 1006) TaxID=441959 RepID=B8LWF3_TALSN|nr:DNA repair protein (Rad1), putative [Talaromyces stipitatus ATCC 10500]EED24264.1 DNA repair protein (Rad1), putative [Talaromyces stipitatus ATCC 10500]